jgi:hypothetical protein
MKKYVVKHIPSGKFLWEEFEVGFSLVNRMENALLDDKSYAMYIYDDIEEMYIEDDVYESIKQSDLEVYEVRVKAVITKKLK